jgi:anti-sigma factor RsiW
MWTRHKDLKCREAVELVTDYQEGALTRPARRRFERHISLCPNCREYLEQIRAIIRAARRHDPPADAGPSDAELVSRYRAWRAER